MAPHRVDRRARRSRATGAISTLLISAVLLAATPAEAAPPPSNSADAVRQLHEVADQAEIRTEEWKAAREALAGKQQELAASDADAARAAAAAADARADQQRYRGTVDTLAAVSFQGGSLNQLSAFVLSKSPQDFLDRASALDLLARNGNAAIAGLTRAVAATSVEEQRTATAKDHASRAAAAATRLTAETAARADDMSRQVDAAKAALAALTAADRARLAASDPPATHQPKQPGSGGLTGPLPPVSGAAAVALRAALNKIGSSYVWGAKGPDTFDCSGLAYWAYRQAGVAIGGSTSTQTSNGFAVSRSGIQPGDLVFFYSPVHHVGIAVDGNRVVHAPDFGQTVKISAIDAMPFNSARRVTG